MVPFWEAHEFFAIDEEVDDSSENYLEYIVHWIKFKAYKH